MSGESSSVATWSTHLEQVRPPEDVFRRPDDPRLGEIVEFWRGNVTSLTPGRAVLIGFPQDEGVRRNHGRPGAAEAPHQIRHFLYRLTPGDAAADLDLTVSPPLDLGNVRMSGTLEATQQALGEVIAGVLQQGSVPIVLGGGHETAYGHFLGYVLANRKVGIINVDAHLDVRPRLGELGHSGSPFRQALEHPTHALPGTRYVCLGAQSHSVSRQHWQYLQERGGIVRWLDETREHLKESFQAGCARLAREGCQVYVTLDADVVQSADVPGVSAPNANGLSGAEVIAWARHAGSSPHVG